MSDPSLSTEPKGLDPYPWKSAPEEYWLLQARRPSSGCPYFYPDPQYSQNLSAYEMSDEELITEAKALLNDAEIGDRSTRTRVMSELVAALERAAVVSRDTSNNTDEWEYGWNTGSRYDSHGWRSYEEAIAAISALGAPGDWAPRIGRRRIAGPWEPVEFQAASVPVPSTDTDKDKP
jgi:hypothetical protein